MNSRIRKYQKSYQNYQQAIEKHLNDDFAVYQILTQNKLAGNNIDEYSKLFNSMLVTKNDKRKKYEALKVDFDQMTNQQNDVFFEKSQVESWSGNKNQSCELYDDILVRTSTQVEIKNTLCQEIVQIKKSLNLLKGDIGHLVGRNESANLLESKISKVKIVADDQLKRVSQAFVKDKDELKIRGDMQKKFTKKVKHVTMYEDTTLKRMKRTYIDTMVKKRQIHDRLNQIQKISASINATGQKEKFTNETNKKTLELIRCLSKLSNLIEQIPEAENTFLQNPNEQSCIEADKIHEFVNWLKSLAFFQQEGQQISQRNATTTIIRLSNNQNDFSDIETITQDTLQHFQVQIVKEYKRIMEQIEMKTSEYNLKMKHSEEMLSKLNFCQEEIQKLEINLYDQIDLQYRITSHMREEYSRRLKQWESLLKTIFFLLQYIQKNINYSSSTSHLQKKFQKKLSQSNSKFLVCRQSTPKLSKQSSFQTLNLKITPIKKQLEREEKSLIWMTKSYISELYRIYCSLARQDDTEEKNNDSYSEIYIHLQSDIGNWLQLIKQSFVNSKRVKLPLPLTKRSYENFHKTQKQMSKMRDSLFCMVISPKTVKEIQAEQVHQLIEQNQFHRESYLKHHTMHQDASRHFQHRSPSHSTKSRHAKNSRSISKNVENTSNQQKLINLNKLKNSTQNNFEQAQRIQLLQNVDKHYYKMLKSTIKMEKQNTRKNYLFLKTFKRAKYSTRDQILQQKRFECSFSMLFAGNRTELMNKKVQNDHRKSNFLKTASLQKRFSKIIEPIKMTQSQKIIKLRDSGVTFSDNGVTELKQNLKILKHNASLNQVPKISKRNLSIEMKDIINLV